MSNVGRLNHLQSFMKRWLFMLIALVSSLCHAQQKVEFADGQVEVVLPDEFKVVDRPRQGLVATFGPGDDHKVELVFIEQASGPEDIGERFIRDMNRDKGRLVLERPGKVAFMAPAKEAKIEGKVHTIVWQVGFGRSIVVVYLTPSSNQPVSPALEEFLSQSINVLITSIRRKGV